MQPVNEETVAQLFDRVDAHQIANGGQSEDLVGPLGLTQDQSDLLRVLVRQWHAEALQTAQDLKDNPHKPKGWRDSALFAQGAADGFLICAADLLDDETILDDPNNL